MRSQCSVLTWIFGITVVFASTASAQQWTRFRGPNGSGLSDERGLPAKWSQDDYDWRVKLPGQGHSSPVLWGERVFLMSADSEDATRYVVCLSARDGKTLWQREYPSLSHHLHARNTFASPTPAVDSQRVYLAWSTPEQVTLLALDHDGNDVWTLDMGPWTSQHGFGTSPILYEDMVILCNNQQAEQLDAGQRPGESFMLACDAATGEQRWKTPRTSIRVCYSTPCIYEPAEGSAELICTSTGDGIYSLNPATGKENWRFEDAFRMRVCSSPLIAGGLIFGSTGSGGGGNYITAVRPGPNAEIAYTIKTNAPYVPTLVAKDGLMFLFFDKGIVSCVDVNSGEAHWRERLATGFSGSPVLADGKLYCISDDGTVHVIAASSEFQKLGENPLGEDSRSTPAVANGRLYFRTLSHLVSVGGK